MKNLLKITGIVLTIVFALTNCCRNKLSDETYFYVNASTDNSPLKLYIDGEYKGELPFIDTGGNYNHYDIIKHEGLFLTIKTSSFKAETRNAQGKTITSAVFKRTPKSISRVESSAPVELTQTSEFIIIALQDDSKTH